jgi:hypothetical protein
MPMAKPAIKNSEGYNTLAQAIFDIVARYCNFPAAIVATHCKAIQKTPHTITPADLPTLAPRIGDAVARFTNPVKGETVRSQILELEKSPGASPGGH